jgi:hypothetical protein
VLDGEQHVRNAYIPRAIARGRSRSLCRSQELAMQELEPFLRDRRYQRVFVFEVVVRRAGSHPGRAGRRSQRETLGSVSVDQIQRRVQKRAPEVTVMVALFANGPCAG